jgi:hypothetical protein
MASTKDAGETPPQVAELATEQARLKGTAVIGIFGSDAAPGALIREANGRVTRVEVGDRTPAGTVTAIGKDRVHLKSGGKARVLKLPKV